ncbi:MAG: DUF2784 domain-containing protein [Salinivirgaceae bacterium]|nr:MAG: DUF2784 domain-containing protein [Salinivirgaceae bacterium]
MNQFWWHFLDYFFIVFHSLVIIVNLFGWIWKKTRKLNLILLTLTGLSWGVLGIFYGMGYCPLTDWHFSVLHKLGEYGLPNSYIKYFLERLTGLSFDADLIDKVTLISFIVALVCSIVVNFVWVKKKR